MSVIMLVGGALFESGHSDDLRLAEMVIGIPFMTALALQDLGVTDTLEAGPVGVNAQRVDDVRSQRNVRQ